MRKSVILMVFLFTISLVACGGNDEPNNKAPIESDVNKEVDDQEADTDDEKMEPEENNDSEAEENLSGEEISNIVIEAVMQEDWQTIANYVHPEKGLLLSPHVHVEDDAVVIEKDKVSSLLASEEVFDWGLYDGKGTPIELTPAEYVEEFLDMTPYEQPDEILVNDLQDRGNTINNVQEKYPDAEIIEYYYGGSEEYAGIDWSSVLFVYEKSESGDVQLIAIVRDMWTI